MSEPDWIKAVLAFAGTALGVLLGLLGNSYLGWQREKQASRLMLTAIGSEASSNKVILNDSFLRYYKEGMVLREFSVATISQYLSDRSFIKNVESSQLVLLGRYLRALILANAYRKKHEDLLLATARQQKEWIEPLITFWGENLEECRTNIEEVLMTTHAPGTQADRPRSHSITPAVHDSRSV